VDGDGAASGVAVSAAGVAGMEGEGEVAVTRARFLGAIFQEYARVNLRWQLRVERDRLGFPGG